MIRRVNVSESSLLALLAFCLALLSSVEAAAKERTWYRYENQNYVAFSNESERTVRKLLEELEYFRAAVLQFANLADNGQIARPNIIIFRSSKEFSEFIGSDDISGIAINENGALYMILAAGADTRANETVLRHEYTHLLVAQNNVSYPTWFNEGFAELMSATTFRNKNTVFSVGDTPGRPRSETRLTPWSEVLSDDFNPHSYDDAGRASDTYLQSWALVHYFLLGNEGKNRSVLSQYMVRIGVGDNSLTAFESAVGMPADEFGETVLANYEMQFWLLDFNTELDKHSYVRTELSSEDFDIFIERFRGRYSLLN